MPSPQADRTPTLPYTPRITSFYHWAGTGAQGLFAFVCNQPSDKPVTVGHLDAFDYTVKPRVSVRTAFELMASAYRPGDMSLTEYLAIVTTTGRNDIPADREARAFAAAHFQQQGIPATALDIQLFNVGSNHLFMALLCATDRGVPGRWVLVPPGYEHVAAPVDGLHRWSPSVLKELTAKVLVTEWPPDIVAGNETFLLYVPAVNRLTGEALTKPQATAIAEYVLNHNTTHPGNPMLVFTDESTIDSGSRTCSLASITGADFNAPSLGSMSDWTLTVVTPGLTFPGASPLVSFAYTTNTMLRRALPEWINLYSPVTEPTAVDARAAAAELCLTPRRELVRARHRATHNLTRLRHEVARINTTHAPDTFTLGPHLIGGRYITLSIAPTVLHRALITNLQQIRTAITGNGAHGLLNVLPDDIFAWSRPHHPTRPLALRATLDITDQQLTQLLTTLDSLATTLHTTAPHDIDPHTVELVAAGYPAQRLARALIDLRDRAGMTPQAAAWEADLTTREITLYENGHVPTRPVLHALLIAYDVPTRHVGRYDELHTNATTPHWWTGHPDAALLSMEHHATTIRTFHPTRIPDLLRTDHARALLTSSSKSIDVAGELDTHRRRLNHLDTHRPQLDVLIYQPTLHNISRTQLNHLIYMSTQDNTTIRIVPSTHPLPAAANALTLLSLPDDIPDFLHTEDAHGTRTSQDPDMIRTARMTFEALTTTAMTTEASRTFLHTEITPRPTSTASTRSDN